MANLNLSQFTEKTFVADADWVFVWDTAGAISKKVSRNSLLNSGTLATSAPVTISQTWADGAQTFKALVVNAAGTSAANSASGSLLLDLQVGGVSSFRVQKDGHLYISNSPSRFDIFVNNTNALSIFSSQVRCLMPLTFSNDGAFNDTFLLRDGAPNTLALRNSTAAQTFNVYGTYTSGTSYERLTLSAPSGANAIIGTNKGSGGGTASGLDLHTDGAARMTIGTTGNVGIGTTAPSEKLEVAGNGRFTGTYPYVDLKPTAWANPFYFQSGTNSTGTGTGVYTIFGNPAAHGFSWAQGSTSRMSIDTTGNVGIGTTSPSSKLHVAGNSSPTITVDNTLATGASQLLFKNTVVTGDTDGIFLNGSTQTGFGGAGSLNVKATTGPIAFHTASVTNALSIAQNGAATFAGNCVVSGYLAPVGPIYLGGTSGASTTIVNSSQGVLKLANNGQTDFDRLQLGGTADTFPAISRDGAGIKFTGAAAGSTSWIKVPPVAVSALPLANTAGAGARAFVNDASAPTFGSAVTGGGAVLVPVYSTGSAWNVG